ncbi:hypothetical protein EDB19DRAFT_1911842 [Suillus lakei]|nr:hypothetical protein EDB19DRAFT_1911842 [Suillus lakei]
MDLQHAWHPQSQGERSKDWSWTAVSGGTLSYVFWDGSGMELQDYGELTAASSEFTIQSHPTISTITEFYDARIMPLEPRLRPVQSSFFFWISSGVKFMLLAGGGSIYTLILMAAKDICWSITTAPSEVSWEVGKMLRHPDKCTVTQALEMQCLIQGKIIPIIAALRKHFPLSMPNVINGSISLQLDCTYIRDVDRFIDSVPINQESTGTPATYHPEAPLFTSFAASPPPPTIPCTGSMPSNAICFSSTPAPIIPCIDSTPSSAISVSTVFNRNHPSNLHFPGSCDRVKNLLWMIEQRRIVEDGGMVIRDIDELKEKLSTFYPGGIKQADTFLVVPMLIIPGALDIRNSDGSLMALICTIGLDIFKNRTVTSVSEESQDPQVEVNEPFRCMHFSHWNRYGLTGHTVPQDVHPHDLEAAGGRRTNLRQTLPYTSKETFTQQQLYLSIQANLGDVFEWIEKEISHHLPDEYKVLVKLVDILPNAEGFPVRPFLSLVVNINVCTVAHRDAKDFELCLVLAVGEFTGGGLVMREQGLVAELRNGDFEGVSGDAY